MDMSNRTSSVMNAANHFPDPQPSPALRAACRVAGRLSRGGMLALFLIASFPSFADQTWVGGAVGSWNNSANWSGGTVPAASEVVIFNTPDAVVSVDADTTIKLIRAYAPATLTLNSPLHIVNLGMQGTDIRADLVVNGPSTLDFSRNGTSTTDLLDLFVRNGATLTVNAKLTGANSGIETWAADNFMNGTYVFANPPTIFPTPSASCGAQSSRSPRWA